MLHEDGYEGPLGPWDWHFYSGRRRLIEHDLNEAQLKPFFQLDGMIEAAFACAQRLFGLEFKEIEAPRYHPDVRVWEVTRKDHHVSIFMGHHFTVRPNARAPGAPNANAKVGSEATCAHRLLLACLPRTDPSVMSAELTRRMHAEEETYA